MQFIQHQHDAGFLVEQCVAQAVVERIEATAEKLRKVDRLDDRAKNRRSAACLVAIRNAPGEPALGRGAHERLEGLAGLGFAATLQQLLQF